MSKHLEKGERLLQKGKLEGALEEYLLAWKDEPSNDSIVYTVAELYHRLQRPRHAQDCYIYLLDKALEKNDGQRAVELLRKMHVIGNVEPSRIIKVAKVLEKQRPELAFDQYKRALESAAERDPETALECLQGLARLKRGSAELQRRIAATATKLNNTAVATGAYQRLAEMFVAAEKWPEAVEALEQVCALSPKNLWGQLALARACVKAGMFARVVEMWKGTEDSTENREQLGLLARAYMAERQPEKAERIYWKVLDQLPEAPDALLEVIKGYFAASKIDNVRAFLKTLEERVVQRRSQKEVVMLAEKISQIEHSDVAALDQLSRILDRLHLDSPLANVLNHAFDLYYRAADYRRAAETLERLVAVDPYNPDCTARIASLQGKVESSLLRDLSNRLGGASVTAESFASAANRRDSDLGSSSGRELLSGPVATHPLRDLMLQAEIFLQYGMKDKAQERLERIAKLYPGAESTNSDLRALFEKAGITPVGAPSALNADAAEPRDVRADLRRVSEISRNLSRQTTVKAVLSAAVNDIGRLWRVSRCVAGLATPGRPPSMAMEYITTGVAASDPMRLGKLVMGLQQAMAGAAAPLVAENVGQDPKLAPLAETLTALQVESLTALPLRENDQDIGILVLEQCSQRRAWRADDIAALEALAEQIVLAVSTVKLRSLMKALAVTDERSGLLHRDSYLTCLLSETERTRMQNTPLSVALLEFTSGKRGGEQDKSIEDLIARFSGLIVGHLRQNDIAIRYAPQTLAFILPSASGKDAAGVTEKIRKLALNTAGADATSVQIYAGVAELMRDERMDSVDLVTELINRVESSLESAHHQEASTVAMLEAPATA